jgi:hypothetical protein
MSTHMTKLARSQDLIGWRNFLEGRVSCCFAEIQDEHLPTSESRLSTDMWMRAFISCLIHISHAQWILRNFMLHDTHSGYLQLKDRIDLINKIEVLSNTPAHDIPEESRFLLDIDTNQLAEGDLDSQDYWVHAMEAATAALTRTSTHCLSNSPTPPRLSTLGTYTLMEEIAYENQFRRGMRRSRGMTATLTPGQSESHRAAQLASNRRRKPD